MCALCPIDRARVLTVRDVLGARGTYGFGDSAPRAAGADGPVADTAEPVAPQAGVVDAEPDGDDTDAMAHG